VQAQTLSFSIQNNATSLQTAINTFAFTGVLLDVIGAFLALHSSTLVQANMDRMDGLRDAILVYTLDDLSVAANSFEWGHEAQLTQSIFHDFMEKILNHVKTLIAGRDAERNDDRPKPEMAEPHDVDWQAPRRRVTVDPFEFFQEVKGTANKVDVFVVIGDAAGIAIFSGIVCFIISVLCLAKATQPPSVWISAIVVCSCIITLPVLNKLLDLRN